MSSTSRFAWILIGCLGTTSIAIACSSAEPEVSAKVTDPLQVVASAETRQALGVALWGASSSGVYTRIRGYSATGQPLVALTRNIAYGDGAYQVFVGVEGKSGASMVIEVAGKDNRIAVASNDLGDNALARSVILHLSNDLERQKRSGGTSLTKSSVRPLNGGGTSLTEGASSGGSTTLNECVATLVTTLSELVDTVKSCALASSDSCGADGAALAEGAKQAAEAAKRAYDECTGDSGGSDAGSGGNGSSGSSGSGGTSGGSSGTSGGSSSGGSSGSGGTSGGSGGTSGGSSSGSSGSGGSGLTPPIGSGMPGGSSGSGLPLPGGMFPDAGIPAAAPKPAEAKTCAGPGSGFVLPFPSGNRGICTQGRDGKLSHNTPDSKDAFDFATAKGGPVVAMADGVVVMASAKVVPGSPCYDGGGAECRDQTNYVLVKHAGPNDSLYLQLATVAVKVGDTVTRGQTIGTVGSTGESTGPHAHVQVQERCGSYRCNTVPFVFADVPKGGVPTAGQSLLACTTP